MKSKQIHLLEQETIDKIAAGEVVERPSSVVKELVENAIDAGSNAITVEIREGGTTFIRITDNGEGIEKEQIRTAFLRHATSKIRTAADLETVSSLGFRGEALSSISAVSQMELITKTPGSLVGSRYLIEGGREMSLDEIGAPEGSTFLVKNLFYNTPARKKFLKSPVTEGGYIASLIEHLALSHPEVSFKLILGGSAKIYTSGNGNLKDVIYSIYGRQIAASLLAIDRTENGMHLYGFIGKPDVSRGNRTYENYFVGGRYIRSKVLSSAIEDAYKGFMMQHRYPFTVLSLDFEGSSVDVNVHPQKMEVRFADNEAVYALVQGALRDALTHKELIPSVQLKSERQMRKEAFQERARYLDEAKKKPEPFEKVRRDFLSRSERSESPYEKKYPERPLLRDESKIFANHVSAAKDTPKPLPMQSQQEVKQETVSTLPGRTPDKSPETIPETLPEIPPADVSSASEAAPAAPPQQLSLFEDETFLSQENLEEHHLIGQLFNTYWLIEFRDELYIIDQHAAHEKVMYERFCKRYREKTYTSQQISPPMIISLSVEEETLLSRYQNLFEEIGFEIEPFGGRDYAITAVPDNLYGFSDLSLFTQMLDELNSHPGAPAADLLHAHLATMACKAAVKGGMHLSFQEANSLIQELLKLDNPYHCPHGRPTIIRMSKQELEKKFKRIL